MNTKFYLLAVLLCLSMGELVAQPKKGIGFIPLFRRNLADLSVVDTGHLRASYALNADSIADVKTYIDLQYLEVGSRLSKYYSAFVSTADSLIAIWRKEHPHAQGVPIWLGEKGKEDSWSEYQYSEYFKTDKELTEYARMPMYLQRYDSWYTEPLPVQQWDIQGDTLTVCGYLCQKAICSFRGRDFIAWFTTDIPVSNGPWKFGGLPGLIMKVYDKDRFYTFECVQVEQGTFPIKKWDYDKLAFKQMERTKLLKLQRKINENYPKVCGLIDGKTGKPMSYFTPYEPLELE